MNNKDIIPLQNTSIAPLVEDLRQIINQSRSHVAANVNTKLYLRWSEAHEMEPGEEQIELLQLDKSGIKVAQYMTELPSKELLQSQLQKGLEAAKARRDNRIEE